MGKDYSRSQRRRDLQKVGFLYSKKFRWISTCLYCGQSADTKDHMLPIAIAARIDWDAPGVWDRHKSKLVTVPCCKSCNCIAGDRVFETLLEKRRYIQAMLREKNIKHLRTVQWDDDELEQLGKNMRSAVISAQRKREELEARIYYPGHKKRNR